MAESKMTKAWGEFSDEARSRYGVVAAQHVGLLADAFQAGFVAAGGTVPKGAQFEPSQPKDVEVTPEVVEPDTEPGLNLEEVTVEEPKADEAPVAKPRSNTRK